MLICGPWLNSQMPWGSLLAWLQEMISEGLKGSLGCLPVWPEWSQLMADAPPPCSSTAPGEAALPAPGRGQSARRRARTCSAWVISLSVASAHPDCKQTELESSPTA